MSIFAGLDGSDKTTHMCVVYAAANSAGGIPCPFWCCVKDLNRPDSEQHADIDEHLPLTADGEKQRDRWAQYLD